MDTLRRSDVRMPSIVFRELVADALLIAGFVLMVLGIYEIGGLFNLGLGFAVIWLGAIVALADMHRKEDDLEEEFFRIIQPWDRRREARSWARSPAVSASRSPSSRLPRYGFPRSSCTVAPSARERWARCRRTRWTPCSI